MNLQNATMDIQEGCDGAADAMISWLDALVSQDFDRLEGILDDRYAMTCDPSAKGGRFNKTEFIALDRHIRDCKLDVLGLTARRCEDVVVTQLFMRVEERFEGDLGPGMPPIQELASILSRSPVAYASMWREDKDGSWRCVQHHVFGPIGRYRS